MSWGGFNSGFPAATPKPTLGSFTSSFAPASAKPAVVGFGGGFAPPAASAAPFGFSQPQAQQPPPLQQQSGFGGFGGFSAPAPPPLFPGGSLAAGFGVGGGLLGGGFGGAAPQQGTKGLNFPPPSDFQNSYWVEEDGGKNKGILMSLCHAKFNVFAKSPEELRLEDLKTGNAQKRAGGAPPLQQQQQQQQQPVQGFSLGAGSLFGGQQQPQPQQGLFTAAPAPLAGGGAFSFGQQPSAAPAPAVGGGAVWGRELCDGAAAAGAAAELRGV